MEIRIGFRNPRTFWNQWIFCGMKVRAIFIWILYGWVDNTMNMWTDYGIRVFGIEINIRQYNGIH